MSVQNVFVLKYSDGRYVKRDDSTGPMSTGGYPYPVESVYDATKWNTIEDAARYGNTGGFRDMDRKVYPLKIEYVVQAPVDFPELWTECNHHCIETKASTSPDAKHYLDCPVMKNALRR